MAINADVISRKTVFSTYESSQQRIPDVVSSFLPNIQSMELPTGKTESSDRTLQDFFASLNLNEEDPLYSQETYSCFQGLFKKYKLGSHYCIIDLFNIYFSERLHHFRKFVPEEVANDWIMRWSGAFIQFFTSLQRHTDQVMPIVLGTTEFFFLPPYHCLRELRGLTEEIFSTMTVEAKNQTFYSELGKNAKKRLLTSFLGGAIKVRLNFT